MMSPDPDRGNVYEKSPRLQASTRVTTQQHMHEADKSGLGNDTGWPARTGLRSVWSRPRPRAEISPPEHPPWPCRGETLWVSASSSGHRGGRARVRQHSGVVAVARG